jgi:oligoribonuclease NrnB/cAMP/cGMP phosphodiesterase (DHH superfamily)
MTTSQHVPIICIYHDNCADGFGAAWVVRKALGTDIELYAAKHGDTPPDVTGKNVFIVDFSYPREALIAMAKAAQSLVVLDHHKTAQADLLDLPAAAGLNVIFDMNRSGAGMAWDFFFPRHQRPALISHIEDRDLWRFQLDGTREVMASVFSYSFTFEVWDALIASDIEMLKAEGIALERKQQKDVAQLVQACQRRMAIGGFDVPVANLPPTLASDAGNLMCTGEPFAAIYWDTADGRVFSLRSTDQAEDVSVIAKQYGGGGHRNASGFKVSFEHPLASPQLNRGGS